MKKTLTLGLSIAALAVAGTAVAQNAATPRADRGEWANKTMTRADAQAQAIKMFDRMDANKDGKLDQADRAARKAQMFAKLDTDKNGQLSPAELDAGHTMRPDRARGGDNAGMDHAGMAGMDHARMGGGKMGGHRMGGMRGGMGAMADANKDGVVSRDEFVAGALARFDAGDTNRDGTLTPAERQAAHTAMKAQWQAKRAAKPAA